MAEEHRFHASEGHRLCVNNCGFFGSPTTQNMCSKCYGDLSLKQSADSPLFSTSPLPTAPPPSSVAAESHPRTDLVSSPEKDVSPAASVSEAQPQPAAANRCSACRKKVGLMGFRCRCGTTFCGTHRYPEKHDCTFDFKAMGKEAIARANPVVKGEKLRKI